MTFHWRSNMFLLFFLILVLPKYMKIYSVRKQHPMHGSRFLSMICTVIRSPLDALISLPYCMHLLLACVICHIIKKFHKMHNKNRHNLRERFERFGSFRYHFNWLEANENNNIRIGYPTLFMNI